MNYKKYKTKSGKPIRLWHGDCMDLMEGKPENHWDLAIVDPPYGIGQHNNFISKNRTDPRNGREIICKRNKRGAWDNNRPDGAYFDALSSISNNQVVWGGNCFADLLKSSYGWIVWDKVNGDSDQSDCELAWTSFDKGVRQIRFMWCIAQGKGVKNGHIAEGNNRLWEKRIHPTQKPIKVCRWVLNNYADEGDAILDTHGGSMSLAIACYIEDFELDIIELDKDYYDSAVKRFEQHISQKTLF